MPFNGNPTGAKLTSVPVIFNGYLEAGRRQVFSGFNAGDIRGHFRTHEVYPEWWGLERDAGTAIHEGGRHDRAINAAISTFVVDAGKTVFPGAPYPAFLNAIEGNLVSLAAGTYWISAPLDLSSSLSVLRGAGDGRTIIEATTGWDQNDKSWIDCVVWPLIGAEPGKLNHSALIWIGSGFPTVGQSFRTGVRGLDIRCNYATKSGKGLNGTGRVSGISSKGWVEENSIIEDVSISNFSGFGVGFGRRVADKVATVNGLTLRNFWIKQGLRRDAYPIYFTFHAGVASVEHGTIDCRMDSRANSAVWELGDAAKGTLTLTGNPASGDTVTIGSETYQFTNAGTPTGENRVKCVAPGSSALLPGTGYSTAMTPHPSVRAVLNTGASPDQLDLTVMGVGTAWNRLILRTSVASGRFYVGASWTNAETTFAGGTASVPATGKFRFESGTNPTADSWLLIGPKKYTFVNTFSSPAEDGEVKIAGSGEATLANLAAAFYGAVTKEGQESWANLIKAINGTGIDGTNYSADTDPHPDVTAAGKAATQIIGCPLTSVPSEGDTVTIGGYQYRFQNTLDSPQDIKRQETGSPSDSIILPGTNFSAAMSPHPNVTATLSEFGTGATMTVTAKDVGHNGNSIATTKTGSQLRWGNFPGTSSEATRLHSGNSSSAAQGTLTLPSNPSPGDTVTIGGKVYTFLTTLSSTPTDGEVKIAPGSADGTLLNFTNAIAGAAYQTLLNLQSALNGGTSTNIYTPGSGTPNPIVSAGAPNGNALLLMARSHKLSGNEETVASASLLVGGPYLEGGAPLTEIVITAKDGGTGGNSIATTESTSAAVWAAGILSGGYDYSEPEYVVDWPLIGIHAQGAHLNINNVHIEGVGIGVNVVQSDGVSSVSITNVDAWLMNDADMAFTYDAPVGSVPVPTLARQAAAYPATLYSLFPQYWNYSCAVLISRTHVDYYNQNNGKDRVSITNVGVLGGCKFILRDAIFGIEHSAFGHGQFPNQGDATITFYARGDSFSPSAGVAPYAVAGVEYSPGYTTSKTYFLPPLS